MATVLFMEWGASQIKWRAVPLLRASAQCSFRFLLHYKNTINNPCHLPVRGGGDGAGAALLGLLGYASLYVVCLFDMLFLEMLPYFIYIYKKRDCMLCRECLSTSFSPAIWQVMQNMAWNKKMPLQTKLGGSHAGWGGWLVRWTANSWMFQYIRWHWMSYCLLDVALTGWLKWFSQLKNMVSLVNITRLPSKIFPR